MKTDNFLIVMMLCYLMEHTWYWHSSIARTAPSLTESMKPGLRLQNFTCNSLYKTKFSNSTIIKVAAPSRGDKTMKALSAKLVLKRMGFSSNNSPSAPVAISLQRWISISPLRGCSYITWSRMGGGGSSWFITLLHRGGGCVGVRPIYYNISWGRDPQIVLRNIWTAPNGNNLQGLLTVGLNISIQ